jgi:hypothetical protein
LAGKSKTAQESEVFETMSEATRAGKAALQNSAPTKALDARCCGRRALSDRPEFYRLLDRKIDGFRAVEYFGHVKCELARHGRRPRR